MTNESFEIIQENKLGSQSTQIAQQNNYYGLQAGGQGFESLYLHHLG